MQSPHNSNDGRSVKPSDRHPNTAVIPSMAVTVSFRLMAGVRMIVRSVIA